MVIIIILFDENEKSFDNLGLGALPDAKACRVTETLNDSFELELLYPITGFNYSNIKLNRIIFCKPNPYSEAQPYRISFISKPINGQVTINAVHISYDMNGIVVNPINGNTLKDALDKIQNGSIIDQPFALYTDKTDTKTFETHNYFNMRALLIGSDESIIGRYKGEILFDKFNVYILNRRGSNKGAQIRYAKNLKDITHEISYDRLYNKVYPFYHKETTTQEAVTSSDGFKQAYIVGSKPFQDGWLSFDKNGKPYHPVDEAPIQIGTDGEYYQKVYTWNVDTERYVERIYNEMLTLIDQFGNILSPKDTPPWIYIDWTGLPHIICKANKDGYYKLVTETAYKFYSKGSIIFDSSIKEAATNLVIYYSEVIPTEKSSQMKDNTSITHVELKDKIIELDADAAKEMKFDRVLALDLTGEFDETPKEDDLKLKALDYIAKNKIGEYKYTTSLSFIDLSATTEGVEYKNIEKIELGDVIRVIYDEMGINVELRVISTMYDVILDRYEKIDLGEVPEKLSSESVQNGDNVSSLTNDVGYADVTTVNKLIAKTITADYIKAMNADLSKAQIEELTTARIKVTGMLEASQFEIDKLVAKMLIADDAVIKNTLEAGQIKVKGDITVTKGEITIQNDTKTKVFNVDREGNVTANAVTITGGELNINDNFVVGTDGILSAKGADIEGSVRINRGFINIADKFIVNENGILSATGANIQGTMNITSGKLNIADNFIVTREGIVTINGDLNLGAVKNDEGKITGYNFLVGDDGILHVKGIDITDGHIIISDESSADISKWKKFEVTNDGNVYANSINIEGGTFNLGKQILDDSYNFSVTNEGAVSINKGSIKLGKQTEGYYNFSVTDDGVTINKGVINLGAIKDNSDKIVGYNFSVTDGGEVSILNGSIKLGVIPDESGNPTKNYNFLVGNDGILHVKGIDMTGGTVSGSTISNGSIDIGKLKANADGASIGKLSSTNSGTTLGGVSVNDEGTTMSVGNGTIQSGSKFGVTNTGVLTAYGATIYGSVYILDGEINLFKSNPDTHVVESKFHVSPDGVITATAGTIGGFTITDDKLESKGSGVIVSTTQLKYSDNFTVNSDGVVTITSGSIGLGKNSDGSYNFKVYEDGKVTMNSGTDILTLDPSSKGLSFGSTVHSISTMILTNNVLDIQKGYIDENGNTEPYIISYRNTSHESAQSLTYSSIKFSGDMVYISGGTLPLTSGGNPSIDDGTEKHSVSFGGNYNPNVINWDGGYEDKTGSSILSCRYDNYVPSDDNLGSEFAPRWPKDKYDSQHCDFRVICGNIKITSSVSTTILLNNIVSSEDDIVAAGILPKMAVFNSTYSYWVTGTNLYILSENDGVFGYWVLCKVPK